MNQDTPLTYGIYLRESIGEPSSSAQLEVVRSYLLHYGVEPKESVVYVDNDRNSRTAFEKLSQDLKSAQISTVVCWRADRLDNVFDDLQAVVQFLSCVEQSSGRFIAVADGFESSASRPSSYASMLTLLQTSKERLRRERAQTGLLEAKENGRAIGRPSGGHDDQVLRLRASGKSIRGIAGDLRIPASTVQSILERKAQTQV